MTLADDESIKNVALYVSTFKEKAQPAITQTAEMSKVEPDTVSVTGSTENGKTLYGVCASCHGADGAGKQGSKRTENFWTKDMVHCPAISKFQIRYTRIS